MMNYASGLEQENRIKILSYLNVSNISNLEADSGYVFERSVLEELYKCWHQIVLIGPPNMPNLGNEIEVVEIEYPQSKYGVRFGFNWEELRVKLLPIADTIDVIWVNQSELSVQLALLLYELTGKKIPCVTYYHYLAIQEIQNGRVVFDLSLNLNGVAEFIWQRQIESALYSDEIIIGSNFGKELFLTACNNPGLIRDKINIIPPPIQDYVFDKSESENPIPVLIYNHRLYGHYSNIELFKVLEELRQDHEFKLLVTDPTKKRSIIRKKLDTSIRTIKDYLATLDFVEFCHFETQYEYYKALQKVDIGLGPFRNGALWNMAVCDVMSAGKPAVALREGAFPEIIKDDELLFSSRDELRAILAKLLSDTEYRKEQGRKCQLMTENLSIGDIGEMIEEVLIRVVKKSKKT